MSMTRDELFTAIQHAGMIPVPVSREGDEVEILDYFEGDFAGFLRAAKDIGSRAVYVMEYPLEEDRFFYAFDDDPTEPEEGASDHKVEEVDLCEFLPSLAQYRQKLGEVYYYFLMARGGAAELCFVLEEDWVLDFEDEIERAEGMALLARRKGR